MDECRKDFESWLFPVDGSNSQGLIKNENGDYALMVVENYWKVWQVAWMARGTHDSTKD